MGPVTDLPMQWRFWIPVWLLAAIVVTVSIWMIRPVQAAPPATSDNCEVLGTIGTIIIGKCIDPDDGTVIYGNSAGFMPPVVE